MNKSFSSLALAWVLGITLLPMARANTPHVQAELLSEAGAVSPGAEFWVAVRLVHEPGWHTYYKDPGDSGLPTRIEWSLPEGFSAGGIEWPVPKRIESPPLVNYGYEGEIALLTRITAPTELAASSVSLSAVVHWLECKDICLPGRADVSLNLPVSSTPPSVSPSAGDYFRLARQRLDTAAPAKPGAGGLPLVVALLFALAGGVLLNLMPCVLPVLSIKVLGFLNAPKDQLRAHGLLYAAGVILSFWLLAGLLLVLRAGGERLGWGFQLQSPVFVALMVLLFVALGLNLFGLFEVGVSLTRLGSAGTGNSSRSAFLTGCLAVLVATPCTAPFMGPALGVALTQPAAVAWAVFTALGVGMALPYVLFSYFPAGLSRLPKPGPWMLTLKEGMAFLFFATAVWLLWVLGLQSGSGAVAGVLFAGLGLGLGTWMGGPLARRAAGELSRRRRRWGGGAVAILSIVSVFFVLRQPNNQGLVWEPFSDTRVSEELGRGRAVFIDFTAAWCLTCQVNKRTALASTAVADAFREHGIVPLRADWTDRDPHITRALEFHGRSGVPLYVLQAPGERPVLLPTLLTAETVVQSIQNISQRRRS